MREADNRRKNSAKRLDTISNNNSRGNPAGRERCRDEGAGERAGARGKRAGEVATKERARSRTGRELPERRPRGDEGDPSQGACATVETLNEGS